MWKAALLVLALLAPISQARAQPPVWVVRDADSELVLFGSVHVLPPGLDWAPPALKNALGRADDLWFELPIDPASELEVARLAGQSGLAPPRQVLSTLLTPDGAARLRRVSQRYGVTPDQLDRLEPWFAEVALATALYRRSGGEAATGVEKTLAAQATPAVARRAFETPAEQIAMFSDAPIAAQVASLEETLREMEEKPDQYDELVAAWMAGDLQALDSQALKPLREASPLLFARLVTQRNARWTQALRKRLAGRGRTVVVVGVGHLIGPQGLPARLRALGYSVTGP